MGLQDANWDSVSVRLHGSWFRVRLHSSWLLRNRLQIIRGGCSASRSTVLGLAPIVAHAETYSLTTETTSLEQAIKDSGQALSNASNVSKNLPQASPST